MRNETSRVTLKQESRSKVHTRHPTPPQLDSDFSSPSHSLKDDAGSPSSLLSFNSFNSSSSFLPLSLSFDQQAISFLFNTFIAATPFETYLASFYAPYSSSGGAVDDACAWAIDATALAAYARHSRQLGCQDEARAKYAGALTRVNAALADPELALQDRTLAAVLVLGLFEATMFQAGSTPTSWMAHTWGAMQLLLLRGLTQFTSPTARHLFIHTSSNVKATCIQRSISIPEGFLAFDKQVRGLLNDQDPAIRLANLLNKVSAIKARSRDSEPKVALLFEAIEADQEIIDFCNSPPPMMRFTREPLAQGPAWTYKRIVHTYPNLRLAKLWNSVRLLRIFLLSFLGNDIQHFRVDDSIADPETRARLMDYARTQMADVATDVLATVPSFVHSDDFRKTFLAPGRCLGWPLSIIEISSICNPETKLYARKTLEWLAEDLNLPQAIDPERHPGTQEDWCVFFFFRMLVKLLGRN